MGILIKFWKFLDGKKRTIASIYWAVLIPSMLVVWPDGYPQGFPLIFYKFSTIFGLILTSVGLGHAAVKSLSTSNDQEEQAPEQVENKIPVIEQETQQMDNKDEGQVNADKKGS